jgi:hypothetical protein
MTVWTYKLWRTAGAATMLSLTACGEGGEAQKSPAHEAGEAAAGESGAEHGETGVAGAYAGLSGDQLTALRLQHLKAFVLVAERAAAEGQTAEAGILVSQGLLEVYDVASDEFGALDAAPVRAAASGSAQSLQAAHRALDAVRPADADSAALTVAMTDIAAGLYQNVAQPDFVDSIEYQHSLGAALSARDALVAGRPTLRPRDARAYDAALGELDRFIALWPSTAAPERPTQYSEVLAQSSRVRLALSPLL